MNHTTHTCHWPWPAYPSQLCCSSEGLLTLPPRTRSPPLLILAASYPCSSKHHSITSGLDSNEPLESHRPITCNPSVSFNSRVPRSSRLNILHSNLPFLTHVPLPLPLIPLNPFPCPHLIPFSFLSVPLEDAIVEW